MAVLSQPGDERSDIPDLAPSSPHPESGMLPYGYDGEPGSGSRHDDAFRLSPINEGHGLVLVQGSDDLLGSPAQIKESRFHDARRFS
jgi:hypothetical protein